VATPICSAAAPSKHEPVRLVVLYGALPNLKAAQRVAVGHRMVLRFAIRIHDRVTGDKPGTMRQRDRVHRKTRAHVRRDRVPDQLLAA
jgi:hypothetical protein